MFIKDNNCFMRVSTLLFPIVREYKKERKKRERENDQTLVIQKMHEKQSSQNSQTGVKVLSRRQALQGFPIALTQVNADNDKQGHLNEVRKLLGYFLYHSEIKRKN